MRLSNLEHEVQPNRQSDATWCASSPTMRRLDEEITRVAQADHPVLITGETGTGKTTIAHLIHDRSKRTGGVFVDLNCAAIPDGLVESELFGFERGAFTGATGYKRGLFQVAEKGTLFLDEVGELKLALQAKLLKAIEQQRIRRLGGIKDIQCNVRVLAASSRNLQRMVKQRTFRDDLYYRLAVFELDLPPLRERREDIRDLVYRQLADEQPKVGRAEPFELEKQALRELCSYSWPGNIRQLHNVLARLACCTDGQPIEAAHVRAELSRFKNLDADTIILPDSCSTLLPGEGLEDFSYRVRGSAIEAVKNRMGGSTSQAARRLRVDRSALHRTIQRISTRMEAKATLEMP